MTFKPGEMALTKQEKWHPDYANRLFLVLEVLETDDDDIKDVMGVSGNKNILLDHINGGSLHAYDSELEELR